MSSRAPTQPAPGRRTGQNATVLGRIEATRDASVDRQRPHLAHFAIDPRNPQTVYLGADGPAGVAGVFKTSNGGRSWRSTRLPAKEYVLALALDPQNPRTVYARTTAEGGGHLFKSTDAGSTWRALRLLGS